MKLYFKNYFLIANISFLTKLQIKNYDYFDYHFIIDDLEKILMRETVEFFS